MDFTSLIGGLASAGANIAGSLIGQQQQQQAQQYQRQLLEQLLQQYQNIPLPVLQRLAPQLLGASAEGQVTSDPALQQAQMAQLGNLSQEASQGGMTGADRAAMLQASNTAAGNEQAQRSAISNMLAARGLGGSGAAVGAMLSGQRAAQDRQASAAQQSQIAARQRALQAMQGAGTLAGQIRGQQFSEADQAAKARDLFAQYNNQSLQNAQQYNAGLPQQQFANQMAKEGGISDATTGLVGNVGATGAQNAGFSAGLGQGLGQMGAGLANYFGNQRKPTNTTSYNYGSSGMTNPSSLPNPDWSGTGY